MDTSVGEILRLIDELQSLITNFFVEDLWPGLPFASLIDKLTGKIDRLEKCFQDLDSFYQELIDERLNTQNVKSCEEDQDILDILIQLKKEQLLNSTEFTNNHIKAMLTDVLVAGTDASAATVVWAMTALIKNPKVMKKVQEEVQNVIPRVAKKDTILQGYIIKEKTLVHVNALAIGRDPESWENPEEFLPERFLGSDIDFRGNDFEFIPFRAGRRICPGISFGVVTAELLLANLVYLFDWGLPVGMTKEDIEYEARPGVTMHKKNELYLLAHV
ncbi:cytochrome P450 71A1-like protein [Tanacetum coccineum]